MDDFEAEVIKKSNIFELTNICLILLSLALVIVMALIIKNATSKADGAVAQTEKTKVTQVSKQVHKVTSDDVIHEIVYTNGKETWTTFKIVSRSGVPTSANYTSLEAAMHVLFNQ